MKNKLLFFTLFTLYCSVSSFSQRVGLGSALTGDYGDSNTDQYTEYKWSHSSQVDKYRNIIGIRNNVPTSFELKIKVQNSVSFSSQTITKFIPAYTGNSNAGQTFDNINLPWSNEPDYLCIDGYVTFEFIPVTGTALNHTPTGAPSIISTEALKLGEASRYLRAASFSDSHTAIDKIIIENNYKENASDINQSKYNYVFKETNVSGTLISTFISLKLPDEIPVNETKIIDGHTIITSVYGNTKAPIKLLPGAILKGVAESYFYREGSGGPEDINLPPDSSSKVSLYPTIVYDFINIDFKDISQCKIEIYDMNGLKQLEKTFTSSRNNLDISFLTSGWYFFHIYADKDPVEIQEIYKN